MREYGKYNCRKLFNLDLSTPLLEKGLKVYGQVVLHVFEGFSHSVWCRESTLKTKRFLVVYRDIGLMVRLWHEAYLKHGTVKNVLIAYSRGTTKPPTVVGVPLAKDLKKLLVKLPKSLNTPSRSPESQLSGTECSRCAKWCVLLLEGVNWSSQKRVPPPKSLLPSLSHTKYYSYGCDFLHKTWLL